MEKVQVSVYQQAKSGESYCGDSFYYVETADKFICALADGLGSGQYAKESSQIVIDIIRDNMDASIQQLMSICNKALIGKRGVVLGILKMNFRTNVYSYASIGNIGILYVDNNRKKKRSIPNSGFLTGYPKPFRIMEGKLEEGMNFIMFSDGVTDIDLMQKYLLSRDVTDITESFSFAHDGPKADDTTLIAMRYNG
ncbi:SpoIIE family protein phosphatase [Virgibacillus sp. 179-BFC.A HS]|uniref:SpoIIE family protein phosphatase n=1 Tax=Tigheibacillus jepli TaxID=3035914 RepID=A0ABU5CKQ0_9BACI|nr:SpoIIE family protein phosphatase [Virgibacillus sp. 179-BFC.A HS]MDY0406890.1 SpoIIE family protein phosphatase [Virgibacillus sp. 179-BFC.A HS]